MPTVFDHYQTIANSSNGNRKIVLDGVKGQDNNTKTPKALSLWGRFVQVCKDLFTSKETAKANNLAVMTNLKEALKEKFTASAVQAASPEFNKITNSSKSLRARNVRTIIDLVSKRSDADALAKTEADTLAAAENRKKRTDAAKQKEEVAHQKTDKGNYSQKYNFDKTFAPKFQKVPVRLIVNHKPIEAMLKTMSVDDMMKKHKIANKFVLEPGQPSEDAYTLLTSIGVNSDNIKKTDANNHFAAVYNSIVDDATAVAKSKRPDYQPETRILQQKNLLKAMELDPSLASKILDYFDQTTKILEQMCESADKNEEQSFAEQFIRLMCAHNGFAKTNGLDENFNFDQMLTVAVRVGISNLSEHRDLDYTNFANWFSDSCMNVDQALVTKNDFRDIVKNKIFADETVFGAYQHIPNCLNRKEYSRCPNIEVELRNVLSTQTSVQFKIDWQSVVNKVINEYMQSELDMRQIEGVQSTV